MKEAVDNKTDLPKNNWIYQFDYFEDIVKVLKVRLSLDMKLSEKILLFNLKNELQNTLNTLFYYIEGKFISISEGGKVARKVYDHDLKSKIYLTNEENDNLILFCIEAFKCSAKDTFISKAVAEGLFLEYDYEKKNFSSTHSHYAATLLCEEIRKLNNELFRKSFSDSYMHFLEENKLHVNSAGAFHSPLYIIGIAAYSENLHNITVLSKYLRNRIIDKDYKKGGFYTNLYYGKGTMVKPTNNTIYLNDSFYDEMCKE